jgi:hypothetical protein
MDNMDWMGYKLTRKNFPTFHHLVKKCDGGSLSIENGAVLGKNDHTYLHIIEYKDYEMYLYINNILKEINNQRYMPTYNQICDIDDTLYLFEKEHCSDTNKKGELIIKPEYTRRLIKR